MKKKLLVAVMALTAAICCALGLVACDNGNESDNSEKWGTVYTAEAAYAVAKDLGYNGTLEEFIQSISGKDGKDGKDGVGITSTLINNSGELIIVLSNGTTQNLGKVAGTDGTDGGDGTDGLSAYEIYLKYHPEYGGTEQEWVESLIGTDGEDGVDGTDGADGKDGVGVADARINENGELIIVLTNDKTVNCGNIAEYYEQLQYTAIKENNEIIGYSVIGLGSVSDADLVIHSTYRGKPVTTIAAYAFQNLTGLESITIPDRASIHDLHPTNSY